jgi:NAD-dependent dihydropyrimidine dehydrogenase PreA subunit
MSREEKFMAYYINESCTSCGACEPRCPVGAISEGPTIYIIDAQLCNDCAGKPICVRYCPVNDCIEHIES